MIWILYNSATGGIISTHESEPSTGAGESKANINFEFGSSQLFVYKWNGSNVVRNNQIWVVYDDSDGGILSLHAEEPNTVPGQSKVIVDFHFNLIQPFSMWKIESGVVVANESYGIDISASHRNIYFASSNSDSTQLIRYQPSKVEGVTTNGFGTIDWSMTANNRIENVSSLTKRVEVIASVSADKYSGGSDKNYIFYIAHTGSVIIGSKSRTRLDRSDDHSVTCQWIGDVAPGQYIEVWVENIENNDDVVVKDLNISLKEI